MPFQLVLNRGNEELIHEHPTIEQAFDAAVPWITKGYIARIVDEEGSVKYTQVLADDREGYIATYQGDATSTRGDEPHCSRAPTKPWWKFW